MSETEGFLGVPEAAVAAGVSERTMWRWVRDGAVESRRVGGGRVVRLRAPRPTRIGEAAAAYGSDEPYLADPSAPIPWPYTHARLEERRRWLLEGRRAPRRGTGSCAARRRCAPVPPVALDSSVVLAWILDDEGLRDQAVAVRTDIELGRLAPVGAAPPPLAPPDGRGKGA